MIYLISIKCEYSLVFVARSEEGDADVHSSFSIVEGLIMRILA